MKRSAYMKTVGSDVLAVRIMLAWNALAGWTFICPGPEIPVDGGHIHRPRWVGPGGERKFYESQAARGIVFP
jgi:hypothetical protein